MPHRPDEEGAEPEGGGAAERLKQHLDARFPEDELPEAAPDVVRDAADEATGETPPFDDASAEAVTSDEGADVPDENLVAPDDRGEPPETSWREEDSNASEDQQQ
jgi:hypothetical protein